ncbi:MAG: leucine-rich repeat protein, partial [Clostridia bacterium]|nr:leucine-rich repeat protein [Clostridia bacterium]
MEYTDCTVCGEILKTKELPIVFKYELNSDGKGYTLVSIGSCNDEVIEIPATYNGLPVTEISYRSFFEKTFVKKVTIPYGVETIGFEAFAYCSALTEINIPDSVTYIKHGAFYY